MTGSPASVHVLALAGYLVLLGFLIAVGPTRAMRRWAASARPGAA